MSTVANLAGNDGRVNGRVNLPARLQPASIPKNWKPSDRRTRIASSAKRKKPSGLIGN